MKNRPASLLLVLLLTVTIPLGLVRLFVFSQEWYEKKFTELSITQQFKTQELNKQVTNLFSYLKTKAPLDTSYYTPKEQRHLVDIASLVQLLETALVLLVAFLIAHIAMIWSAQGLSVLLKKLTHAGIAATGTYLVIVAGLLTIFDTLFYSFHRLAFRNTDWQLDPIIEKLIVIFPPELFAQFIQRVMVYSLITSILVTVSSLLLRYYLNNQNKFYSK